MSSYDRRLPLQKQHKIYEVNTKVLCLSNASVRNMSFFLNYMFLEAGTLFTRFEPTRRQATATLEIVILRRLTRFLCTWSSTKRCLASNLSKPKTCIRKVQIIFFRLHVQTVEVGAAICAWGLGEICCPECDWFCFRWLVCIVFVSLSTPKTLPVK